VTSSASTFDKIFGSGALDSLIVATFPRWAIVDFLERKRSVALDKNRTESERAFAVSLLTHDAYIGDLSAIALDKHEKDWPRRAAIDALASRNKQFGDKRFRIFLQLLRDRNDDRSLREKALQYVDDLDHLLPLLENKSEDAVLRKEIVKKLNFSVTPKQRDYVKYLLAVIEIVENPTEDSMLRRWAIQALDPEKHQIVLWALRSDPDHDVRIVALNRLHKEQSQSKSS